MNNKAQPPAAFSALRAFSWIVLALMAVMILYAAWHSIANWTEIRV